jgi:subtilisin family serine protease
MAGVVGCAGGSVVQPEPSLPDPVDILETEAPADATALEQREPVLPPRVAMFAGLMPNRSIKADEFRVEQPTYDGRGVIIGILDSGIDADLPGLRTTTTGQRKVLDIRDFSGEGRIVLTPLTPGRMNSVEIAGRTIEGLARVRGIAAEPYYGGVFREITLGSLPAGDLNGNGEITDEFAVVVARASDGWVAVPDANGDGSLADERPVRDYAVAGELFRFRNSTDEDGPLSAAVNLVEVGGEPVLDLVVDNSSHGTHVSGIAAGHNLFGVEGFDGAAPGAHLLALKIANNTRGGISVTGSMIRAMRYAAEFAARRGAPLILNLSYGVGNEAEGAAVIDSLIDVFALEHPGVLVVISAGNDGPGLSTLGFPGSAEHALTVCAVFPGVFAKAPEPGVGPPDDVMGWWSARGGELAKPDVCGAGVAYSNVPGWRTGEEISGGTSMAAPQVAGAAALLQSGMLQNGTAARAIDLKQALMATAVPIGGTTILDEGRGVVNVTAAYRWLVAAHQPGVYKVLAQPDGANSSTGPAAYRRKGLGSTADTLQSFEPGGGPLAITVFYDAEALSDPGLYVGTVWATPATDTMAGPSFGLTNTVITPHTLDEEFAVNGLVTPGAAARYFFEVPVRSGGLTIELGVKNRESEATLYLFEPSGQPYLGGSRAVAGSGSWRTKIVVLGNDVVPGVYEAVVVAPPLDPVSYGLSASVPGVSITNVTDGPVVTLRNTTGRQLDTEVAARLIGGIREVRLDQHDRRPARLSSRVPEWAAKLAVEVEVATGLWRRITDFGVTVFDSVGRRIADGPVDYPVSRQAIEIDSSLIGQLLNVELLPAFALEDDPGDWSAEVRLSFLSHKAIALPVEPTGDQSGFRIVPSGSVLVTFIPPLEGLLQPEGFVPLLEIEANPERGVASVRRGASGW